MDIKSSDKDTLLMCRSCEKELNIAVRKCIHCGDKDPFFFNWVEKSAKIINTFLIILSIGFIILNIYIVKAYSAWLLFLSIPLSFIVMSIIGIILHKLYWNFRFSSNTGLKFYAYDDKIREKEIKGIATWEKYIKETIEELLELA